MQIAYPTSRVVDQRGGGEKRAMYSLTTESTDDKLNPAEISNTMKEDNDVHASRLPACFINLLILINIA